MSFEWSWPWGEEEESAEVLSEEPFLDLPVEPDPEEEGWFGWMVPDILEGDQPLVTIDTRPLAYAAGAAALGFLALGYLVFARSGGEK
tara:strand:- start:1 stop:264 length:264 start_codon:yes stop_codon:yes gene_type:complete